MHNNTTISSTAFDVIVLLNAQSVTARSYVKYLVGDTSPTIRTAAIVLNTLLAEGDLVSVQLSYSSGETTIQLPASRNFFSGYLIAQ